MISRKATELHSIGRFSALIAVFSPSLRSLGSLDSLDSLGSLGSLGSLRSLSSSQ